MHIIKPAWLSHSGEQKDFEVYSCHVSPDGKRLATAGGDGHVRIWSTEAIYNANNDSYTKPRQLCHMSHHLGTIHSVRFSPNGKYLASGADDKIICVYHLDKSAPSAAFGSSEPPPVENWKTYKRLIGHDNDVQDLAWSNDSSILLSVGLDSKVVVWSGHTFEKLKTISTHTSHVKGICFDPANKYLATASDDRTIKIFRFTSPAPNATQHDMVNNFVLESTISTPFRNSPLSTYFRRCSWSPDGNHISASNAVNGPVSSIVIIDRTSWSSDIHLIGHEAPSEVCMFSPRLFYNEDPAKVPNTSLVTVIASAGQDKTLTIWNTNNSRPVVILQDITGKSIVDLSWAPDGQTIFAASLDGSIIGFKFDAGELGWVATEEENYKALHRYGVSRKGMGIAEDVDGLHLENSSKQDESRAAQSRMGALMGDAASAIKEEEAVPQTNGVKNGISKPTNTTTTTAPGASGAAAAVTTTTNGTTPDLSKEKSKPEEPTQEQESAEKAAARVNELKSRVTVGKDGKKRVAPLLVSSSGTGLSSLPQAQLVGSTTAKAAPNDAPQTIIDISKPYDGLPKGGLVSLIIGSKRKAAIIETEDTHEDTPQRAASDPVPVVANGPDGVEAVQPTAPADGLVPVPDYLRSAVLNPAVSYSHLRLAVPKVRSLILRPLEKGILLGESTLEDATRLGENIILEAKNPTNAREPTRVVASKRAEVLWEDFLPRAVLLVAGNRNFWAVACEDGSVHVWTPAGRRLLNPMILESQPVILECRDYWLLCITAVGLCYVWDIRSQSSPNPPVSLGPVLEIAATSLSRHGFVTAPGVTSAHLNSSGHIIITLSNGDGYYYSREMFVWQRLSESWWAVGSQYWNSNDSSISALQSTAIGPKSESSSGKKRAKKINASTGVIPFLERHTTTEFLVKGRAYNLQRIIKLVMAKDGFQNFESSVSIAHLETRIAGSMTLEAQDEFRLYLFMYAKRIGAEGHRGKVEELLNSLVGGVMRDMQSDDVPAKGWFTKDGPICGWDRMELLKGVVMILGKFREVQRLTVQYAKLINLTNNGSGDDEDDVMDVDVVTGN
ncbi:HIR complex subunit [Ceratocystis pirilliformis]|uniref:Protein HIR n=1 Tax=Ceratocystis pirilliformis TaxID=259994 RepID=A0ABR3ZK97_9PEZI